MKLRRLLIVKHILLPEKGIVFKEQCKKSMTGSRSCARNSGGPVFFFR